MADDLQPKQQESSGISLSIQTTKNAALRGVKNDIGIVIDVQTSFEKIPDRPVLNLAIVLDRSGSMSGNQKLASCKKAIIEVSFFFFFETKSPPNFLE